MVEANAMHNVNLIYLGLGNRNFDAMVRNTKNLQLSVYNRTAFTTENR